MAGLAEKGRSEFEGCLSVRDGQLNINMASRNLDDAGIEKWCEWADECLPDFVQNKRLPRREADGFLLCKEANFSSNAIGDVGGRALLRVLFSHKVAVRIVKLFKNHLGRAFASSMMDWLTHTPVPVIELHLSHNYIPREGAVDILKAVGHNKAYPAKNANGSQQPLWLRLEQNLVEKANELLQVAEEQLMKIRGGRRGKGAILSMDNIPRSVPGDAPCPLAQVAYLINQRDHRLRVPPEAQQWRSQGAREAMRWRISLSPEELERASKAPSISLVKSKSEPLDHSDSAPEVAAGGDDQAREAAPGPVWNGLPLAEQLAAKKGQRAEDRPGSDRPALVPLEESDDENSDEAPGPVLKRGASAPAKSVPCKAPPIGPMASEGYFDVPSTAPVPMVKAPPLAPPPPGEAVGPPPSAPPPKPPPMKAVGADLPWEDSNTSYFSEVPLQTADPPFAGLAFTQPSTSASLPFGPLVADMCPPPGLADSRVPVDPKEMNSDVLQDEELADAIEPSNHTIGFSDRQRRPPWPSPVPDESDEEVQNFGPMVQDPMLMRANGVHHSDGPLDQVSSTLAVSHADPFKRAQEVNFRTDLYRIKEAYMQLGREEFMQRIQLTPSWAGGFS